jgi:N-acetylglucosaminyldiphosphoundecaprenol N-acetyl-beta-D-mannosaminyltransferase
VDFFLLRRKAMKVMVQDPERERTSLVRIDGITLDRVTMPEAVARILDMAVARDRPRYICTCNLDHLVILSRDREFRDVYRGASLTLADGAPVVWLSRLAALNPSDVLPARVAGSDLFWELAKASSENGVRLFFLGGVPGAAAKAAVAAATRYFGTNVCGVYCPPVESFATAQEQERIRAVVHAARPDILLVAFGAPKQEKWIAANKDTLDVPVSIGVGGSFEMAAGIVKRAPLWVQDIGLEWFYRFSREPRRLFARYFLDDLPYFVRAAARARYIRSRGSREGTRGLGSNA